MDEALAQFEKARETDPAKVAIYKEIAELHEANANNLITTARDDKQKEAEYTTKALSEYEKAINQYEKFTKEGNDQVKLTDYFTMGRILYLAGTANKQSPEKKTEYLTKADGFFGQVAEKSPASYLGNLWRARANAALDPESTQGLAKPYYEAALATLTEGGNNKNTREIIEGYNYLAYYYLIKNDKTASKSYWNKILEIDPNNQKVKDVLKTL